MAQILPKQGPAFLTPEEWGYILKRDGHQCAEVEHCRALGKLGHTDYCSSQADVDHIHPRHLGGDDTWKNTRLLCETPNRGRPVEATKYWADKNYWDESIVAANLREIQRIAGYDAVQNEECAAALTDHRNELLKHITLLPGVTGIGKAVLALSVMFAINLVVNKTGPGRPRIRRVLWLATERTLRDLAAAELANDIYAFGIVPHRAPSVVTFDSYRRCLSGPGEHDICVSCPQILWDVTVKGEPRCTPDQVRDALSWFDCIVFDEGDWADEQVRRIAVIASHALKFALTASPPIVRGIDTSTVRKFLKTVVLIPGEAIADYERAIDLDGCLKRIDEGHPTGYIASSSHDQIDIYMRGERSTITAKASPDHPAFIAAILHAVTEADQLETRMRKEVPELYYSPHIIVRFDRIEDVVAAYHVLNHILPSTPLENRGWRATAIFQGHMRHKSLKGLLSSDEGDLSEMRGKLYRHPFFRAKNTMGRADNACARILLMCQIGIRGINDWPIQSAVDCTQSSSETEIIQFAFGRPIRLPAHLSQLLRQADYEDFVTSRIYIPEVQGSDAKAAALMRSRDFILDMKNQVAGRGLRTWRDIVARQPLDKIPDPEIRSDAPPFIQQDKFKLMNGLGEALASGAKITDPIIQAEVVATLKPEAAGTRKQQAIEYVEKLVRDQGFRHEEVLAVATERGAHTNPEPVITQLKPQDTYSIDSLQLFVRTDVRLGDLRQEYMAALERSDKATIGALSHLLHAAQVAYYREPPTVWQLQGNDKDPGALRLVANELSTQLCTSGSLDPMKRGSVNKALNVIAARFFAVDNAEGGGPMDHHAYHVAILGRCRRKLQDLTRGLLVKDGLLPGMAKLAEFQD